MRYMLLIYTKETAEAEASPEQRQAVIEGHRAAIGEATRRGILRGAEPLEPTPAATTLRVQGGTTVISDGPFAETKEQLAGYYILDCGNLDEAIEMARKIPTACGGDHGCIEIRPIRQMSDPCAQVAVREL